MRFKVGDRVRVYGLYCEVINGTVESLGNPQIFVRADSDGKIYSPYPQQCRRLVKKERRRVWVVSWAFKNLAGAEEFVRTENPHDKDFKEFVEVKK